MCRGRVKDGETLSQGQGPCTCPWLRVSPSFRLLRAIAKSCVSTMFRGVYANVKPRLCRRNLTSVTCQNIPGPPPTFPIVWEVGPGNKATIDAKLKLPFRTLNQIVGYAVMMSFIHRNRHPFLKV